MSEDNKTNLIVCVTIVVVVAIIGGLFTFYNSCFLILQQTAIEQGYVQSTIPGQNGVFWVKPQQEVFYPGGGRVP